MWSKATSEDIDRYQTNVDHALKQINIDPNIIYCNNHMCSIHHNEIISLHDSIISCCLQASSCCIPTSRPEKSRSIPGWTEFVKPYKDTAMFWHWLWKQNGSPSHGYVANIRRSTRSQYHNVLRKVQKQEKQLQAARMAENITDCKYNEFWNKVKRIRGNKVNFPTIVDNACGSDSIASLFLEKYENLYNCVSYDHLQMASLKSDVNALISDHVSHQHSCLEHVITVNDVVTGVSKLTNGKHDGDKGHFSDHVSKGPTRLHVYISLLFNAMISHGCVPHDFLLSTLVPIPKNKRKSLNKSDNYRAIALSSILGKLLDVILLKKCQHVFKSSDLQFGFKKKHSTNQCTFVVNEVLQYYANNNTNVLITLLDASKAFDRV